MKIHQVFVGGVGLVELHHGELGVVADRDPFVAEVAVDLEDPLEAADHQPLQIELRRDAQEELHVERVVMGGEGPRRGAAGDRLHHRRFDFEEIVLDHEVADGADDAAALLEDFAHLGIDDQIEITLAVAGLDVGETVPLLGQRQERLGEEAQGGGPQGELTGLGAKGGAAGADDIADIKPLEEIEGLLADVVAADVDLGTTAAVLHLNKGGLAEVAAGHDPPGDGINGAASFQSRSIIVNMRGQDLLGGVGHRKIVGKGIDPLFAKLCQFGAPLQ